MASSSIQSLAAAPAPLLKGRFGRASAAPGVIISEITDFAAAGIVARKGQSAAVAAVLSELVASTVTDAPKRATNSTLSVTGIATGQWLAIDQGADRAVVPALLSQRLAGMAAVTEQGSGRILLHVSGQQARATLAKGVPIDLDAEIFHVGDAAQSTASHVGLGIALIDTSPRFELVSALSTRASLLTWLLGSAAEFGGEVV